MTGKTHMAFGALFTATGLPLANSAFGLHLGTAALVGGVVIGTVAGMLPDIDHPDSLITHGVIPGAGTFGTIGKALGWFLSIPPRVVGVPARATMNHRGGTHSILFMLGWSLLGASVYALFFAAAAFVLAAIGVPLLAVIGVKGRAFNSALSTASHLATSVVLGNIPLIALSVFLGYLSHLVADSLNNRPVPWPWPLKIINGGRWFLLPPGLRVTTGKKPEVELIRPIVIVLALAATFFFVLAPAGQGFIHGHKSTHSTHSTQSTQSHTAPYSQIINRKKARQMRIRPKTTKAVHRAQSRHKRK
jgi:membrane-bound metal-dependent hydrolase YbcI (DUF457 family)